MTIGRRLSTREIVLIAFAAMLFLGICYWRWSAAPGRPFDHALWLRADSSARTRAEMVDDLLERQPLRRLNRLQLVGLLGPPTPTDKWDDWEMAYVLGPHNGWFGIDHEWLLIDLDDNGLVARYEVTTG